MKNKLIGYIALSSLKGIGPAFIKKISSCHLFESNSLSNEIKKITSENKKKFEEEAIFDAIEDAKKTIEICITEGIDIIFYASKIYPESLKEIKDPPPILYCKGNLELLQSNIVGIIGTREPTATGIEIAQRVGRYYSQSNWTICNGLADGIDSYTIKIDNDIKVIGVLAGGLNFTTKNTLLKNTATTAQMVLEKNGLLISEIKPNIKEDIFSIVKSCRIQAGISKGLILIQSSIKGGSRFTTKSFCEISRPLGIIKPIPKDFNLVSYEANKKIIENKEVGISEFTGLGKEKIKLEEIHIFENRNDFSIFEEKMHKLRSQNNISSLFI